MSVRSFIVTLTLSVWMLPFGCRTSLKPSGIFSTREYVITEGIGFDKYKIDSTPFKDILHDFGKGYKTARYDGYVIEIIYEKLGLSFFYNPKDSLQRIVSISFFYPFKGITSKGIVLNKSIMLDVQKIYESLNWYTTDSSKYWTSTYTGIEYSVDREMSLPRFPLDEQLHSGKVITRIEVVNND